MRPNDLVEALAHELARLDGWQDPNALWTDNLGIISRGGEGSPVYLDYVEDAQALVAGPLAPLLAALQSRAFEDGARKAEIFARRVHLGQTDKGGAPYSGHLGRVAARARGHAEAMGLRRQYVEWCLQVGWLHDTIEDTPVEADDLLDAGFDPAVVQAVGLLTRDEADNGPTYLAYVRNIIASGDRIAMIVKLSDNEDNTDPARPSTALVPRSLIERCTQSADLLRAALAEQEKRDA